MSFEQANPNVLPGTGNIVKKVASTSDYTLLGIAIVIDVVTMIPFDVTGIGFIIEAPLLAGEAFFLKSLGVPSVKSVLGAVWDFVPILDIMPWCTLAVLDKRFGVKVPYLTKLYNR